MRPIKKPTDLIGKTIAAATYMKMPEYDDERYLRLRFTDGAECYVVASYGGYTGTSEDEYPAFVRVGTLESDAGLVEVSEADAT